MSAVARALRMSYSFKVFRRAVSTSLNGDPANNLLMKITEFTSTGEYTTSVVHRSELLARLRLQPRDIRFSTATSLYQRGESIILRLQDVKAVVCSNSLILLDSDGPTLQELLPELKDKLTVTHKDPLPFEFRALEAMLMKMFSLLDGRLSQLEPALREVLNNLLDPRLFSVDRGQLHILLHHSKSLSEFDSLVRDIESTLSEMLDNDEDIADMYLSHVRETGEWRSEEDIEDLYNILEGFAMQSENLLSEVQKLRELIDQSESIILINLDSQRNIMLRLSLQLEMGMFSSCLAGLIGVAFGMNLDSSLEENTYAFWVVTGVMLTICGLLWRRLLLFLGKNLDRSQLQKLSRDQYKKK
ncbi:magnesium transporter MRS2 homolog, mitochondrial-like [Halichondria panicea]|uniref:magnesium transporter MRS2 homolog, mitochondrial-like n=1 Tax=Halichondria panicea TaxID=6063 RepID=UPI00312BB093